MLTRCVTFSLFSVRSILTTLTIVFSITVLIAGLSCCTLRPESLGQQQKFIQQYLIDNPDLKAEYITNSEFKLHYRAHGEAKVATILWIHGTPGSWTDSAYLITNDSLLSDTQVVSLDRPGWGESQYTNNPRPVPSMSEQVKLIAPLVQQLKHSHPDIPLILVGHSWGASLVPQLLQHSPNTIDGLLLLAGGLSPELTQPRWYNKFARSHVGQLLLTQSSAGQQMRQANLDIYALQDGLFNSAANLAAITVPTIVLQGEKDRLVDPANADFAEQHLNPEHSLVLRLPDQGHLLQAERSKLIAQCIRALTHNNFALCSEDIQLDQRH